MARIPLFERVEALLNENSPPSVRGSGEAPRRHTSVTMEQNLALPISKRAESTFDDLPDEVLLNIFNRLPINAVGLCMCVKKSWISLIKSPPFISSFKSRERFFIFYMNPQNLLIHRDDEDFECHKLSTLPIKKDISHKLLTLPIKKDIFYGVEPEFSVCNGFVCFAKNKSTIILWNPTIEKMLTLPQPNFTPQGVFTTLGFGFDSTASDYKVVRILNNYFSLDTHVEVFSLNDNSWRNVPAPRYKFEDNSLPIVNGALHWRGKQTNPDSVILGFDVNAELFREIQLPDSLDQSSVYLRLAVYKQSFIAVYCFDKFEDKDMHLWVMNEYGNIGSWTQLWKFNFLALPTGGVPHRLYMQNMLGLRNNGEVLYAVMLDEIRRMMIISVNPRTLEEHVLDLIEPYSAYQSFKYFEKSLMLLETANAVRCPVINTGGGAYNLSDSDSIEEFLAKIASTGDISDYDSSG